ncbi:endonuclease/exonuclease/phosphatase family protein [Acetobacter sp. AN02]|uniref:endonuclease/exonuclease/phosphatase family protein n=1 Tax=Acetobacter sp. AN02 TaxID=2894186 RepID=UPI00243413EF|nr:endonuclease/exonuclease/phosphatase family protein [Acetobacter sp. AN02]MDG6095226.1 endonuclease/exonuclease/phosphatase family protein [Acetobacter sp. AN02]
MRAERTLSGSSALHKVISWNLLHSIGATAENVAELISSYRPDLLLMQEATSDMDQISLLCGGYYARVPLPGRIHGLACWSTTPFLKAPASCTIPSGPIVKRVAQIIHWSGGISFANVHLSHGQMQNRRQLRSLSDVLQGPAAILGDFNLVGPTLMPGFADVGPKAPTHKMADLVPIRIDRCLVRDLRCSNARVLPVFDSDHRPIEVILSQA